MIRNVVPTLWQSKDGYLMHCPLPCAFPGPIHLHFICIPRSSIRSFQSPFCCTMTTLPPAGVGTIIARWGVGTLMISAAARVTWTVVHPESLGQCMTWGSLEGESWHSGIPMHELFLKDHDIHFESKFVTKFTHILSVSEIGHGNPMDILQYMRSLQGSASSAEMTYEFHPTLKLNLLFHSIFHQIHLLHIFKSWNISHALSRWSRTRCSLVKISSENFENNWKN